MATILTQEPAVSEIMIHSELTKEKDFKVPVCNRRNINGNHTIFSETNLIKNRKLRISKDELIEGLTAQCHQCAIQQKLISEHHFSILEIK